MHFYIIVFFFRILDTETWHRYRQFDCICMLNLLDRCNKPKTMLLQAKDALAPGGILLLALVLPYKPYVEGTNVTYDTNYLLYFLT